jgi:dTDP-4-dehydrorhamnose reductase
MKILITGAGGMLGSDLTAALKINHDVLGAGRNPAPHLGVRFIQRDLSQLSCALEICKKEKPEIVFHAAAMTNVDACEQDREEAMRQNHLMTAEIAKACRETGAFLIFFSTDYVFDGSKKGEYLETDSTQPVNVYGESKRAAEKSIHENKPSYAIFRVSWLYGLNGKSFPRTILERARQQNSFEIVDDQVGRPTFTRDLAAYFAQSLQDTSVLPKMNAQIFHLANSGTCSWAEFASWLLRRADFQAATVTPIKSEKLNRPAKRPLNSVFSLEKSRNLLGASLRSWQDAAGDFVKEFKGLSAAR